MYSDFPVDFVKYVLNDPFLEGEKLLEALNEEVPISIRYNPAKQAPYFDVLSNVKWCENAVYLKDRPSYVRDPLFHAGCYYPQEAGSMFLDTVLRELTLPENPIVLDLCAAPGGKSTLISSFLQGKGLLVSNEIIPSRAKVLKENCTKWGQGNSIVTSNDSSDFGVFPSFFDVIVVDAPCSGEGMFRKDTKAREEWSLQNVYNCVERQHAIVENVWGALQNGGYLIYSTCTFNPNENEDTIRWILENNDAEIVTIHSNDLPRGRGGVGHYGLPSKVDSEGFFIAVVRKRGTRKERSLSLPKKRNCIPFTLDAKSNELLDITGFSLLQWREFVFAVPEFFVDEVITIQANLRVLMMGVEVGELIKNNWIPKEGLALNTVLLSENVSKIEVTLVQALSYLRGETFSLQGEIGYTLITYKNQSLGWIKHLGNRFNNLYPKEWRIRIRLEK